MKNILLIISLLVCIIHTNAQKQPYFNFPHTSIVISLPEHFQSMQDASGGYYVFHPGTNAVIQAIEQSSIGWEELKKSYDEHYFASQNLQLKHSEEKTLSSGIEIILFECETSYRNAAGELVPYKVFLMSGGRGQTTFLLVARYPLVADALLNTVIKETLYSVHLKK